MDRWRRSWLGHLLGIHSPSAHLLCGCWCQARHADTRTLPDILDLVD